MHWRAKSIFLFAGMALISSTVAARIPDKVYKALEDSRYKVRIQAVGILAETRDPAARKAIEVLLGDEEPLVRAAACDALMAIEDPAALPALNKMLTDKHDTVRRRARLAIRVLNGIRALQEQRRKKPEPSIPGTVQLDTPIDQSDSGHQGLAQSLRAGILQEMETQGIALKALKRRYMLMTQVRTITTHKGSAETSINAECHMTVAELPNKTLRLSTQVTAGVVVDGEANPKELSGMARDAVKGAGAELFKEFATWALAQPPPGKINPSKIK